MSYKKKILSTYRLVASDPVVVDDGHEEGNGLHVLEGHVEGERLVVVRVQRALLDRRLLLTDALPILHQRYLHIWV